MVAASGEEGRGGDGGERGGAGSPIGRGPGGGHARLRSAQQRATSGGVGAWVLIGRGGGPAYEWRAVT